MKDLYIIGAGGFGREVAWLVERINEVESTWNLKGFIDDNASLCGTCVGNYKVLGNCEYLKTHNEAYAVCAIGKPQIRKKIVDCLSDSKIKFATLIDPSVIMSKSVLVGCGTVICAGTIMTVDICVGNHVLINLDCTLGHDDLVEDFVTIYPSVNVSGGVKIGNGTELGTGVHVIQEIEIGKNSIVGSGGVVIRDIPEKTVAVGNPAKVIKNIQ